MMTEIDPITREIMQNALAAAADEMSAALYRTAFSTIVRDCLDYSTSLCNGNGQMIAQGVTIPLHLGSVPYAMAALFERFGDDIDPGDVFILNDPFDGGMHIPDIFIVQPIFWESERVAFAVSTAHHLDLGGRLPGSSACDNTEIFQEGIRIPWLKLYRRGEPDESIFSLIRANVRVPQMTIGDIRAQLAACHIGERAVHSLIERYGRDMFLACARDLIDYTERLVRSEIASWPDGSHTFTDYLDSDGVGGPRVQIRVTVTVRGDSLTADFTGTDPQVSGAVNSTLSFTAAVVALCVRAVMREEIPNTEGMFRPLEIIAPEGTLVNVRMPGASSMRGVTGFRMADVVFGALAGLLPDRVLAAGEGGNTLVIIGGQRQDRSPMSTMSCSPEPGAPGRIGMETTVCAIRRTWPAIFPLNRQSANIRSGSTGTDWFATARAPDDIGAGWRSSGSGRCSRGRRTWRFGPTEGTTCRMDCTGAGRRPDRITCSMAKRAARCCRR